MLLYQDLVKEFHLAAGQPIADGETRLSKKRMHLRMDLINEEISELQQAIFECNRTEILDALVDIKYVLAGKSIEEGTKMRLSPNPVAYVSHFDHYGSSLDAVNNLLKLISLSDKTTWGGIYIDVVGSIFGFSQATLDKAFLLVHESNMSKFCTTEMETISTKRHYCDIGISTRHKKVGEVYVVYRSSDSKILKSINYKPVQLHDLAHGKS